jgi:hypothetical protein
MADRAQWNEKRANLIITTSILLIVYMMDMELTIILFLRFSTVAALISPEYPNPLSKLVIELFTIFPI